MAPGEKQEDASVSDIERLAGHVRTLGRGPGRSRPLTRAEAAEAFGIILAGAADAHQIGAFLMLMRYRGETAAEIAGLVDAARASAGLGMADAPARVTLDWPSYGAGRTRSQPWFLLAALALGASGRPVLMHGSNEFSSGVGVGDALLTLGFAPVIDAREAADRLVETGFAYWPLATLNPSLDRLLALRRVLGLRSPVNTAARLLNPFDAPASIEGVFHPPYLDLHLATAETLGRARLLALKGAGGEAERNPLKPLRAHLYDRQAGAKILDFPALTTRMESTAPADAEIFRALWREGAGPEPILATIIGTIALGLVAIGEVEDAGAAQARAEEIWKARLRGIYV